MLAHSGVEALHGRCMPNHGRGRIRAVALHAWHNQDADYPRQPFRQREGMRMLKGRDVSGGRKGNRRPTDTARRDVDEQIQLLEAE